MDSKNNDIFSPIKNSDEDNKTRRSDSFSKFLEGPDAFRESSATGGNVNEDTLSIKSISSKESSPTLQDKSESEAEKAEVLSSSSPIVDDTLSIKSISSKESSPTLQDKSESETEKAEVLSSSSPIVDDALITSLESSCSLKKVDKSDNLQSVSTKINNYILDTSLISKYEKQTKGQKSEAQCKTERKHTPTEKMSRYLSFRDKFLANIAILTEAYASREIKKTECPTSLSQCDPLSQLCSVESSVKSEDNVVSVPSGSKEIKKTHSSSSSSVQNPLSQLHSVESSMQSEASDAFEDFGSEEIKKSYCSSSLGQHNPLSELGSEQSEASGSKEMKRTLGTSSPKQRKPLSELGSEKSEASGSKEMKRTLGTASPNQRKPLSEIQSRIEKIVSDAVESQVDNLQQLMWSHHYSVMKAIYETKEILEQRHASERETLCKIMEELAEENRNLRNAAHGHE